MVYRIPFLRVIGPGGEDMLDTWGSKLIGVQLIDRVDLESDEAIFKFTRKPPYMPIPGIGTPYVVHAGWSETSLAITGYYTFQRTRIFGEPRQGQQLHLICRAGDFVEHLRKVDSEHYDEKAGVKTLGDLFQKLFKGAGVPVEVAPEIAGKPLPGGYMLRWNQSEIDFGADVADDAGLIIKPMGQRILVLKRGAGESVSGKALNPITIRWDENYGFDVELEPSFQFSKTSASYLDTDKGTLEREETGSGSKASRDALPHPYTAKDAAASAAAAVGQEWGRFSGQGHFTVPGMPSATASAPAKCEGYGQPIDAIDWTAAAVIHDIIPNVGWTTTIETEVAP